MNKRFILIFSLIFVSIMLFANVAEAVSFNTTVSSMMRVGDSWAITIAGLNPNETVYAIGGKNGASNTTPYTANTNGILSITGTHTADVIGSWKLDWTRADGSSIGSMSFIVNSVAPAGSNFVTVSNPYATTDNYYANPNWVGMLSGPLDSATLTRLNTNQAQRNAAYERWISEVMNQLKAAGHNTTLVWDTPPGSSNAYYTLPTAARVTINGQEYILQQGIWDSWVQTNLSPLSFVENLMSNRQFDLSLPSGSGSTTNNTTNTNTGTNIGINTNSPTTSVPSADYLNNLTATLNTLIQKYNNLVITSGTGTTINPVITTGTGTTVNPITAYIEAMNRNTTTTNTGGTSTTFPSIITVTATNLNVRSAPNTQASILSKLNAGNSLTATCYVMGENVEGTSKWWKTSSGSYVWTGGTVGQPTSANVLCGSNTSATPVSSTIVPITTNIPNVSSDMAKTFSPCTGEIYTKASDSQACAALAESQGKALGYVITCTSQQVGLLYPEPNTGLMYYLNATCTVNGYGGQGAQLLAGYTGFSGTVNGRSLSWSGNGQGWETLVVNLRSMEAAKICGGSNYGFNQATNRYYCISSGQTSYTVQ